jgi:hypothetical protein
MPWKLLGEGAGAKTRAQASRIAKKNEFDHKSNRTGVRKERKEVEQVKGKEASIPSTKRLGRQMTTLFLLPGLEGKFTPSSFVQ